MKYVLFLLTVNFLVIQCPAELMLSDRLNKFISYFSSGSDSPQFKEILPDKNVKTAPDTEKDNQAERIYEPLELMLVSFDGMTLSGTIANPILLKHYLREGEFVDLLYACPKIDNERDAKLKKTFKDKIPETLHLIIEKNYKYFVDKYIEEAKLSEKSNENNAMDVKDGENGGESTKISNQEQQPNQDSAHQKQVKEENVPQNTPMELDSDQKDSFDANDGKNVEESSTISNQEQQPNQDSAHQKQVKEDNMPDHTLMVLNSEQKDSFVKFSSPDDEDPNPEEISKPAEVTRKEENKNPTSDSVSSISNAQASELNLGKNVSSTSDTREDIDANPEYFKRRKQLLNFEAVMSQHINPGLPPSSEKTIKRKDSSGHISVEDGAVSKKNKVDSLNEQEKKQVESLSDQNKMEIDSGSAQKTDGTDVEKLETDPASITKTDAVQNNSETGPASNQEPSKPRLTKSASVNLRAPLQPKIKRVWETLTFENQKYWLKAVENVENYKCEKPAKPHLLEYSTNNTYNIYISGFDVQLGEHEGFEYPNFSKINKYDKIKFFWAFTIVFIKLDQSVCVYHEVQYNRDTFNPKINDDFDDHDLGKKEMFPGLDIIQLYSIKNQEKVFSELFKNEDERRKYFDYKNVKEGRFLEKLHLAPLHGFLSPVVRQSAKIYGNVALMWKSIKDGAWGRLEEYVNTLSSVLKHLVVITGTYGTLRLKGKEVYLADDKKIPVPLLFWKMVIYQSHLYDFPGILIITSNNPYEDIGNIICKKDACKKYGWGHVRENNLAKGRTLCCDFNPEILKKLPVLNGAQPTQVLDLNYLSKFVDKIWEFDERGEETTPEQRKQLLERLKKDENPDEEMIAEDKKTDEFVENEDAGIEDAENKDPNKIEATVPKFANTFENFTFPNTQVEVIA